MGENGFKILKTEFLDNKWMYIFKKLAYLYEIFNSCGDYENPVSNLTKEDFFSNLNKVHPNDEEIEQTKEDIELFNFKKDEDSARLSLKSDVLLLTCVFDNFLKVTINEFGINPLYCVSLPGYTWQCCLKFTGLNLQTLPDKDLILSLENWILYVVV